MNLVVLIDFFTINKYQVPKFENVHSWCGYPKSKVEPVVTIVVSKILEPKPMILILVPKNEKKHV